MAFQRKEFAGVWRNLTHDETDPARIHIKALSPAGQDKVQNAMYAINSEVTDYLGGKPTVTAKPEPTIFKAEVLECKLRVDKFENILDLDGSPMSCTPENVELLANEVEGFIAMVKEGGKEADEIQKLHTQAKEKNLQTSPDGSVA